jgi:ribosomal protein S12 methylthiotransferase accessory factor
MSHPTALIKLSADLDHAERSFSNYHDRRVTPEETFAAIRPFFSDLGITRIGMLTKLDRLNIPVAFATRPNSFTLSVFQGKGIDDNAAMASAVMEAVETRVAEIMPEHLLSASVDEMQRAGKPTIDLDVTARCVPEDIGAENLPWIHGMDLLSREPVHVPWWLVGMDHRLTGPSGFEQSSDGLASGNSAPEAILHGLCELIERDAWTLLQLRSEPELWPRLTDPTSLDDAIVDLVHSRLQEAGMSLLLIDMTTDIAVPAFFAALLPNGLDQRPDVRWSQICGGCGCHPNPARAALRAITEAAQSRLTAIAGSRDDFSPRLYQRLTGDAAVRQLTKLSRMEPRPYSGPGSESFCSINQTVEHILSELRKVGMTQVIAVPLSVGDMPVSVVRMIVPSLEVDLTGENIRLGARAAATLKRRMH